MKFAYMYNFTKCGRSKKQTYWQFLFFWIAILQHLLHYFNMCWAHVTSCCHINLNQSWINYHLHPLPLTQAVTDFHTRFDSLMTNSSYFDSCTQDDDKPILFSFTGDPEIPLRQIMVTYTCTVQRKIFVV